MVLVGSYLQHVTARSITKNKVHLYGSSKELLLDYDIEVFSRFGSSWDRHPFESFENGIGVK